MSVVMLSSWMAICMTAISPCGGPWVDTTRPFSWGRGGCRLVAQLCPTLCDPTDCSMPGFPVLHHLLELAQTHVHWVGDAIQPSPPLWSPSPPAFNHSQYQSFPVSQFFTAGGPKYWSFSFSSSPSNEYSGLISFRMYWLDLLAVQSTLKSLFQHHVSKATTLWHLAFFIVQLSHPYLTIRKP